MTLTRFDPLALLCQIAASVLLANVTGPLTFWRCFDIFLALTLAGLSFTYRSSSPKSRARGSVVLPKVNAPADVLPPSAVIRPDPSRPDPSITERGKRRR